MTPVSRPRGRRTVPAHQRLEPVTTSLPQAVYMQACRVAREQGMTVAKVLRLIIIRQLDPGGGPDRANFSL